MIYPTKVAREHIQEYRAVVVQEIEQPARETQRVPRAETDTVEVKH